jgi:CTD kinase subunit beta
MAPPRPQRATGTDASNGDRANEQPSESSSQHPPPPPPPPPGPPAKAGPHPGIIRSSNQYSSEARVRAQLADSGSDPAREVSYRLQGVQLLDGVRAHLHLPVRTFDTACIYFHKFRLSFRDAEYNYQDAALASLFVACKVEDTIKKSRDILAAAYNVKNPDKPTTSDDKVRCGLWIPISVYTLVES